MIDYVLILTKKYANNEWVLNGDDYEGLEWLSETVKPSKKELDDLWPIVLEEINQSAIEKEQQKELAHNKLAALGLNIDDLKALGLA